MSAFDIYWSQVHSQLDQVATRQRPAIEQAGEWLARAFSAGRYLFVFGTGHSHLLAEEVFYRAGGLARVVPILDDDLMLHRSASRSTNLERESGRAGPLLHRYGVSSGDVLIVASNGGRNAVPIEMALEGRARGARVIALTNLAQTRAWPSRHASGRHLADVAELVIDNAGIDGDAVVEMEGLNSRIGPTSTLTGALILNLMAVHSVEILLKSGGVPEVFVSSNAGGEAHNALLISTMKAVNPHL